MESKESRITKFLESLPVSANTSECDAIVLNTNLAMMGEGTNNGSCTNDDYEQCHKSKNGGDCKNYGRSCSNTTNKGDCFTTTKPMDPVVPGDSKQ